MKIEELLLIFMVCTM